MTSTIKVNNIQNQCGANIANKCGTTITLGASGDTITLACGASQTGFGRTGTVDWDTTAKTASFTAVSGNGYFVNTTSAAVTMTLPATPSAGDIVSVKDYAYTFETNNLIVNPNGSNIGGASQTNINYSVNGTSKTFVYVDGTQGWLVTNESTDTSTAEAFIVATGGTITCCGDYKIHTFTGPGTFTVCSVAGTPTNNIVDYLVVAGGGGGHGKVVPTSDNASAGGAGGFRYFLNTTCAPTACAPGAPRNGYGSPTPSGTEITVTATSYPIAVGAGGAGNPGNSDGCAGANSTFSTITSTGGGAGVSGNGQPGGSAGGAGRGSPIGSGNTPPVTPSQGSNGGTGAPSSGDDAGSGGGALGVGSPTGSNAGSAGGAGAGIPSAFGTSGENCGSYYYFSGGGGAGVSRIDCASAVAGGIGGGGNGGRPSAVAGQNGTDNTGGGGGGPVRNFNQAGGNGGSGIVIIRYKYQ